MKSCLKACSTLLAALCAFLFVSVATLTLIVFIGDRLVFNASTYKQALSSQHVYDRAPALIAEQIIYDIEHPSSSDSISPELKRLTQADWKIMLTDLLTPAYLKTQAEGVIDQFFTYVNTPSAPLKLKVSLVDFKTRLDGNQGFNATMKIINAQPACNSAEWEAFIASGAAQFGDLPFCRPSADILSASEPYIRDSLHQLVADIPNETYLDESAASSSTTTDDGRRDLQRARRYIWLSLCLPAGLFLLIAVFGVRSLTGCGLWLGLPLVFTGLFGFVAALVAWALPSWLISQNAPNGQVTLSGVAPGVTQMLVDVGINLAHQAARTIGIISILLIVVGVGLLAAGFLLGLARRATTAPLS